LAKEQVEEDNVAL